MTGFISLLVEFFRDIWSLFDFTILELFGYEVSLSAIIFVLIAFSMILMVYWRGAKG